MKTETQPYEFLARWRNGILSGSHIQHIVVTKDDNGKVLFENPLDPAPVGSATFPLGDIMDAITITALASVADLQVRLGEAEAALVAQKTASDSVVARKDAELQEAAIALQSALDSVAQITSERNAMAVAKAELEKPAKQRQSEALLAEIAAKQAELEVLQSV